MLYGHIDIIAYFIIFSHCINKTVRNSLGIEIMHSYPLDTVNRDKFFKQLIKRIFAVQIFSVT